MGVVYLARQRGLNRDVAVKTLLGATLARATLARFWAEAEVMAEVKHPNVVRVIELGEHAGQPFMAMEYVAGRSLADRLKKGCVAPGEAARWVALVAEGVASTHVAGIVHRDIKPGNVLFDAAGVPKVADFGLARPEDSDLTATGLVVGTPAYMAPEQTTGTEFVGPTADVWALGAVLYECLTGGRSPEGTRR
jgi:serine/threonine protein kinase